MFKFLNARLISSLETQVSNLRAENNRLYCTMSDLTMDLSRAKGEVKQRDSHIESIRYDRMKETQHIIRVQRDLADSRSEAAKLRQQVAEQDEEIEELEDDLEAAEAANDCLLEQNLQLSNKVAQLTFREMFAPRVTATEILLRDQLHSRDLTIQNGLNREEALVKERDALKAEVESLKQQRTALVKERNGLRFDLKRTIDNLETMFQLSSGAPISLGTISRIRAALWQLKSRYGFSNAAPQGQPHAKAA
ncbi:hypothetical protein R5W60_06865 [Brucella pseudintermedia]|uniref:hypothetical protein n=1 Tax=Brucella pseudintermedia TaxID=370111 RepID=UPI003671E4ED|nr:hypothetical protein R5W60_06865 [Brucella pseudintermedia]